MPEVTVEVDVPYEEINPAEKYSNSDQNGKYINTRVADTTSESKFNSDQVETLANAKNYQNIPGDNDYEHLKVVVYENTKESEDSKVYTGLDNTKRQSKV